jgi:hypothetical protein
LSAVLWPFPPNRADKAFVIERSYRTDIIVSRSGREQRRALRGVPRKAVEYVTTQSEACWLAFHRAMVRDQRRGLVIAERPRFVRLPSGMASLADSVDFDALPAWIVEGALLVLMAPGRQELRTVAAIDGTLVTFAETSSGAWPAGTRVHPGLVGHLAAALATSAPAPRRKVVDVAVRFEVDPGSEVAEAEGEAEITFQGREVFLVRPDRWRRLDISHEVVREAVDYGRGRTALFHPVGWTSAVRQAVYTACDFARAEALRQLFQRVRGSRGELYMPTFGRDLPLKQAAGQGTSQLRVLGTAVAAIYAEDPVHRAVAARLPDGSWQLNNVTAIAEDEGDSVLTVGSAWPVEIPAASVVSWMPAWRFASDILTASWRRWRDAMVAETQLSLRLVEDLPVDWGAE